MSDLQDSSQALKSLTSQLGCRFSADEEKEAARLWDALNQLADDPGSYAAFMAKQLRHVDSARDGGELSNQRSATSSAPPPFVPLPGFVVKTFVRSDGTKLFVNVCHHATAIQKPVDRHGNVVADAHRNGETLRIPLLVSKLRDCLDGGNKRSMAVDVVVHSWCVGMCEKTASFRAELVGLAMNSLREEHSIEIQAGGRLPWKIIRSKYKGGLGCGGTNPRPFEDGKATESEGGENVAESPSELLKRREEQNEETRSAGGGLNMPGTDDAEKGSTKLIQEIPRSLVDAAAAAAAPKDASKGGIEPGFLNCRDGKKPLYSKEGSTGDGSSGSGGLLSKCKVIDTATIPEASSQHVDQGETSLDPESHDMTQTLKDLSNVMRAGL